MSNQENIRIYRYGSLEVKDDSGQPPEEVRKAWSAVYPDLTNAEIIEHTNGVIEFMTRAGSKGWA